MNIKQKPIYNITNQGKIKSSKTLILQQNLDMNKIKSMIIIIVEVIKTILITTTTTFSKNAVTNT